MNVPNAPIPADSEDAANDQNTPVPYKTPLPKLQLAILCAVRLMDPVTFTQIFPYINEFISRLHLVEDDSQIGFYSGLVVSTFYFVFLLPGLCPGINICLFPTHQHLPMGQTIR